jgi:PAS domain S-box-containing protein
MWGKTWETAIGKGLRENGYEEWHAQMHEREIDRVQATKKPIRGEVSFPHAELGRRIYDYIFNPILNEEGEVEAVAGTTRDITEIRQAENTITESERRFRTMAEGTDILITVSNGTGETIYFNEAWASFTRRSSAELLKFGWADLMHPEDRERVSQTFNHAIKGKVPFSWEFRMPNTEGGYSWLVTKGAPRFHNDGSFAGFISSSVDITAHKAAEQQLQELNEELTAINEEMSATNEELMATNEELAQSERRLQELIDELKEADEHSAKLAAIVESSDDAIIGKNLDGIVTSWNRGAEQLFGYTEAEIKGRSILTIIPEDRQHEEQMILGHLRKGQKIDHYETVRRTADGRLIHVSLTISPILDKEGRVTGVSKIARDISEQKRDEQRKNDFIGMASHELKTPLTSLSALVQMLRHKLKNNSDPFIPQALDKAILQSKRMSSLINGFLNVSRLESGKLEINPETFNLSLLVAEEVEESRLTAGSHTFALLSNEPLIISADRGKIGSVISNLLSNAVKYSPRGTEITIHCTAEDGQVLFSIRDEGQGISPHDLPRIFDRYYRADSAHTKNVSGFGVGLYLSAEIIQRHNGKIWAESEKGTGSTFFFSLPIVLP